MNRSIDLTIEIWERLLWIKSRSTCRNHFQSVIDSIYPEYFCSSFLLNHHLLIMGIQIVLYCLSSLMETFKNLLSLSCILRIKKYILYILCNLAEYLFFFLMIIVLKVDLSEWIFIIYIKKWNHIDIHLVKD